MRLPAKGSGTGGSITTPRLLLIYFYNPRGAGIKKSGTLAAGLHMMADICRQINGEKSTFASGKIPNTRNPCKTATKSRTPEKKGKGICKSG